MKYAFGKSIAAALLTAALSVLATPTVAADGKPVHVRGTVTAATGNMLTLKTREGESVRLAVPEKVRISGLKAIELSKVVQGAYIGTAAVPAADGTLHAREVLVFPDRMRGVGEGHRPWDLTPESTMTNASVEAVVDSVKGRVMNPAYKGGVQKITIPPSPPVFTIVKADRAILAPGAHIFAVATKGGDGIYMPARIAVGLDGLEPPM
jgi:hypothetical protein